ncbi:MAG TPA: ImmA/IrrE family metallo-endopeptidase [Solirubrobacteraceae bacterium]|nr:ImmA/IrrE family metallo-endopeptidase [Solirubrobacteraceae bacterium]
MSRQAAESAANDLLKSTWGKDLAKCELPIDPFTIAATLGLKVHRIPLEPDVSGMLAKHPGQDPEVYVNVTDSDVRQRFSCAHEVGHYVKRGSSATNDDEWGYIDRRGPAAARGDNAEEIYANQFAAALLMPEERVKALVDEGMSAVSMALQFNVSLEATAHRIDNLGLTGKLAAASPRAVSA